MPSTSRGYPYPSGSDDVDIPGDIQALADAVNTDVGTLATTTPSAPVLQTLADAAGDLAVGSAADTFGKLALGTDNYALTVNTAGSGVAKVGWEDPTANPLTTAAMALKVNTATVGNLLTANVASGTDTLADTTGFALAGSCTITSSTAEAWQGSRSLKAAVTGAEVAGVNIGAVGDLASMAPVTAGQTYTLSAYVRPSADAPVTYQIHWRTSDGSAVSATSGAAVTAASGAWTRVLVTGVAPATAAYAILEVYVVTPAAGHVYLDGLGLWEGAGGQWAPGGTGTPIANLGYYVDESVGRRIFHWDPLNNRYQQTYGDTGIRADAVTYINGWGQYAIPSRISRIGNIVYMRIFLDSTNATSNAAFTIPAGFKPEYHSAVIPVAGANTFATLSIDGADATIVRGSIPAQPSWYLATSYRTSDAWPTSLPGTASGSIPA